MPASEQRRARRARRRGRRRRRMSQPSAAVSQNASAHGPQRTRRRERARQSRRRRLGLRRAAGRASSRERDEPVARARAAAGSSCASAATVCAPVAAAVVEHHDRRRRARRARVARRSRATPGRSQSSRVVVGQHDEVAAAGDAGERALVGGVTASRGRRVRRADEARVVAGDARERSPRSGRAGARRCQPGPLVSAAWVNVWSPISCPSRTSRAHEVRVPGGLAADHEERRGHVLARAGPRGSAASSAGRGRRRR